MTEVDSTLPSVTSTSGADSSSVAGTTSSPPADSSATRKSTSEQKSKKKKKRKKRSGGGALKNKACVKRIQSELKEIMLNAPIGVSATPNARKGLTEWFAAIRGPEGTPYDGGRFHLTVRFPGDYPFAPPKVAFKTRIYHCNVDWQTGAICLDVLKDKWSPALTVSKVLLSIIALLQEPNPADPLVSSIAQQLIESKASHDAQAREWTQRFAMSGSGSGGSSGMAIGVTDDRPSVSASASTSTTSPPVDDARDDGDDKIDGARASVEEQHAADSDDAGDDDCADSEMSESVTISSSISGVVADAGADASGRISSDGDAQGKHSGDASDAAEEDEE
jgi:ubiquitin-conjugating enzyme E2 D/E